MGEGHSVDSCPQLTHCWRGAVCVREHWERCLSGTGLKAAAVVLVDWTERKACAEDGYIRKASLAAFLSPPCLRVCSWTKRWTLLIEAKAGTVETEKMVEEGWVIFFEGCHSVVVPNVESMQWVKLEQVSWAINLRFEWLSSVPGWAENMLQEGALSTS